MSLRLDFVVISQSILAIGVIFMIILTLYFSQLVVDVIKTKA